MTNILHFTHSGKIVHSAYSLSSDVITVSVSAELSEKTFMNDSTAEIVLLSSATSVIPQSAFENCRELQVVEYSDDGKVLDSVDADKVDINSSVTEVSVHFHGFKNCEKLHTVIFPKNCKVTIEKEAFIGCKNLRTVVLPDGDTDIASDAFTGCDKDRVVFVTAGDEKCNTARFARENGFRCVGVDNF